ncbi:hemerythrin family protein [Clostridium sp. A1-XYC3]|uniref:Bacteriohemerythrin n=1 Tax=Clostridium tanneri TaxID=3037988 RepID=A0ABU4JT81_9CLOT|nr:hemerythrin family protein [Clostridium sp. A1-XYC3]MDW8801355.1 hemerythrin family protein [Clostridium sp. A1-XYC3]
MFKWKNEYETGVEKIDEQHRKLFEIANNAYELLNNDLYIDKYDRIIQIIEELKEYTVFHFTTEEEYMVSIGYKKILSHKVEHDDFIKKFDDIDFNRIDYGQNEYIMEMLEFIYKWIDEHILIKDKEHSPGKIA